NDIVYGVCTDWGDPGDIYICLGGDSIDIEPELILHGENYAPDPYHLCFNGINGGYDFNGDGYDDILAGGIGPSLFWNGQVDLFFGGEEIDTIPDFHIQGIMGDEFGKYKTAGDINGDGYDDLITSRYIEWGGPLKYEIYLGGPDMDTVMDYEIDKLYNVSLGHPTSNCDINGDNFDDLIIPLYIDDNLEYIDVYLGCIDDSLAYDTQIQCNAYISNLFYCDINNDGFSDIVVAVRIENKVYIYYGGEDFDTEPDIIIQGNNPNGWLGEYGCNLGDFNGNGKNEIIINNGQPFNIATVYTLSGGQSVDDNYELPITNYEIISVYPNPFTHNTNISFSIKNSNNIQLDIYNIKGQRIKTLVSELMKVGNHEIEWDGRNDYGKPVANGIYFYKLSTDTKSITKKMILLR
ncbi:MAG: T9SS type A sorting domain-containing protein, partial [Candidatus Cloacimonetes bacterium]|nr:T9SS type A sorting domain-containing protein [Candidatus Cloacimonadota bacterium]